jgi:succinyl-diaminopimelate desuccinylase
MPLYVDPDTEFIKKLQNVYKKMTGDEPKLLSIGGGTYCRYVKNTVSFGPVFPGQKELAHQKDEYIALEDLRKIAKIYVQAIYELIK